MKHFLEFLGDVMIIFCGLISLLIFVPVLIMGRYYIYEPNPFILWTEITLAGLIILFGIYHLIKDLKQ
jgi:hypothetical protein